MDPRVEPEDDEILARNKAPEKQDDAGEGFVIAYSLIILHLQSRYRYPPPQPSSSFSSIVSLLTSSSSSPTLILTYNLVIFLPTRRPRARPDPTLRLRA